MTAAWDPAEARKRSAVIAFARKEFRNDGAEGESVHFLADQLEAAAAEIERLTARHDSSMRYLRDIENMASTGRQSAVTREDADGSLRLAIFRDIMTAARAAIAGDGLRLNEAMEIEALRAERDAALAGAFKAGQASGSVERDLRAEVSRLQRELKSVTYYEITDDAITTLTDRLESEAGGTPLIALACDAATNIRQLQQTNARAVAERDRLRAEVDSMRPVVDACVLVSELDELCDAHPRIGDLVGEDAERQLYGAVKARTDAVHAYRSRRP